MKNCNPTTLLETAHALSLRLLWLVHQTDAVQKEAIQGATQAVADLGLDTPAKANRFLSALSEVALSIPEVETRSVLDTDFLPDRIEGTSGTTFDRHPDAKEVRLYPVILYYRSKKAATNAHSTLGRLMTRRVLKDRTNIHFPTEESEEPALPKGMDQAMTSVITSFYVFKAGNNVRVMEANTFESLGAHKTGWGKLWKKVEAVSIEHARIQGAQMRKTK